MDILDTSEDWIHSMIKGSSVYVPKPAPKERNPELDRIMEEIKAQVAEKEYQRMISSIDPSSKNGSIASGLRQDLKDMQDVKAHTIGIINVLYTGAAVFTAVFMISAHFTEDLGKSVTGVPGVRVDRRL
ncbi:endoplasmic reticulum-based factor for assembly of V-ATPase-domain-containing protein [Dissophora ornata]|nr:endoplasmic reticulum-based factor for assembly of V-ATPase-domain-containing protein [Dissophora ornata]